MIVVDASVVTDFLIGRPEAIAAVQEAIGADPYQPLYAPELIEPEILNALRGLARSGSLSNERASLAVADLAKLRLLRYPHAPLRERVWALRNVLTACDAVYLALAEALDDPVLITGDRGLANRARGSLGEQRVVHVA